MRHMRVRVRPNETRSKGVRGGRGEAVAHSQERGVFASIMHQAGAGVAGPPPSLPAAYYTRHQ